MNTPRTGNPEVCTYERILEEPPLLEFSSQHIIGKQRSYCVALWSLEIPCKLFGTELNYL